MSQAPAIRGLASGHAARRRAAAAPEKVSERTRDKLMEAAAQVFAERGFRAATVREICRRAGANVASVNYTFGDKMGLYTEVLRQAMHTSDGVALDALLENAELSPEQVIRNVIEARLRSLCSEACGFRMVMHEFAQPTEAMGRVVDEGIRPVYDRMRKAVGQLTGLAPDHRMTRLCVNSIVGQVLFYAFSRPVLERLQPDLEMRPEVLDRIADHIYEFSLAYLEKIRREHSPGKGRAAGSANGGGKHISARGLLRIKAKTRSTGGRNG